MSYEVKPANIFGQLGKTIGKGLSEQLPKEMENYRLRQGLESLSKEAPNLSPLQFSTKAFGTYGITPQMTQSLGNLAQQESRNKAMMDYQNGQNPQPYIPSPETESIDNKTPSITQPGPLEFIQGQDYLPPTEDQIVSDYVKNFNKNPKRYNNNIENAEAESRRRAEANQARFQAHQKQHENLKNIQGNVQESLRNHANNLKVKVPPDIYSELEDEAIRRVKPKKDGGEGETEQQATKEIGKKLDEISRDYQDIESLGDRQITQRDAKETIRNVENLREKFAKRGPLESRNLADQLISQNKVSPLLGYSFAFPVKKVPELNKTIKSIPEYSKHDPFFGFKGSDINEKTLEAAKKIGPLFRGNDKASPLSVAYQLKKLGLEPSVFLDYLNKNQEELGLSALQVNQLSKPINNFDQWNDYWLSEWSGIE